MSILQTDKLKLVGSECVRCHSRDVKPYGKRFYCLACGFTWHATSTDETDELIHRIKVSL